MLDATCSKNYDVLNYLGDAEDCSPEEVDNPYMTLGTHPDLVERLWDQLTVQLPANCCWVVGKRPVLMRKDTGVIFGIAIGTVFYALRLPEPDCIALDSAKRGLVERWANEHGIDGEARHQYVAAQLASCPVGPAWISGKWLPEEIEMSRQAYDWAG